MYEIYRSSDENGRLIHIYSSDNSVYSIVVQEESMCVYTITVQMYQARILVKKNYVGYLKDASRLASLLASEWIVEGYQHGRLKCK